MRSRNQARSASRGKQAPSNSLAMTLPMTNKGTRLPMIANSPQPNSMSPSLFGNIFDDPPMVNPAPVPTPPATSTQWTTTKGLGYSFGVCSQQGRRPYQEDEYCVKPFLGKSPSDPETHFFGLYDGHAGGRCSSHLAGTLASQLMDDDQYMTNLAGALKRSYHTANEAFLKIADKQKLHDGSTGLTCVIRENKLYVANVGDCRALLISASSIPSSHSMSNAAPGSLSVHCVQLTTDHKPGLVEEQRRIAQLGGCVVNCMGVPRVNRVLAVSRAFGNRTLRTVIRPDADLIQKDLSNEDFLIMASDGVWDVLRNREVAEIAYSPALQRRPQAVADELVSLAIARGSQDNCTCIVVCLSDYKPRSTGLVEKENINVKDREREPNNSQVQEDARAFKRQLESVLNGPSVNNNNQTLHDTLSRQHSLGRMDREFDSGPQIVRPIARSTSTGTLLDANQVVRPLTVDSLSAEREKEREKERDRQQRERAFSGSPATVASPVTMSPSITGRDAFGSRGGTRLPRPLTGSNSDGRGKDPEF